MTRFFVASDGALYRLPNLATPLRPLYARHVRSIRTGAELRSSLRAGPYAWPGGYAVAYLADDGELLSPAAVRENLAQCLASIRHGTRDGWRIVGMTHAGEDDGPAVCAHTGALLWPGADDDEESPE